MPRKNRKGGRAPGGRRRRGRSRETSIEKIHGVISSTAAGGVFPVISLIPDTFARALTISDTFDEYRVIRGRFRLVNNTAGGVAHTIGFAYFPGITTTPPTASTQVWDNDTVVTMQEGQTVPSPWKSVSKKLLAGEQPWYKCKGSVTNPDQIPGQFYGAGSGGTDNVFVEMDFVFEFRGQANPNNTPEIAALRAKIRALERARVLEVARLNMQRVLKDEEPLSDEDDSVPPMVLGESLQTPKGKASAKICVARHSRPQV